MSQQRPDDARQLGGERYDDGIGMGSCEQAAQPLPQASAASAQEWQGRARPWISILRKYLLPRLVMPSRRGLPPVVTCRGTSPSQAARSQPRAKVWPSPTAATRAVAL